MTTNDWNAAGGLPDDHDDPWPKFDDDDDQTDDDELDDDDDEDDD